MTLAADKSEEQVGVGRIVHRNTANVELFLTADLFLHLCS